MRVGVPRETFPSERRVALGPVAMAALKKAKIEVCVEAGAGAAAGFTDAAYQEAGAALMPSRAEVFAAADVLLQVRALGANPDGWQADLALMREKQTVIAMMDPLGAPQPVLEAARRKVEAFALELMPRITRAQAMDVLSSQANLAGYKAVLLAADTLAKIFPMMMTAAGTITPSRIFVVGAGVAGLQAIATARRLGGVVSAYDVRPAVKEQVESLGARFVQLPLTAEEAQDTGGYARKMDEAFYARQADLMADVLAESDVVITTAAIPGQKAPILITRAMVERMAPGSVLVDIAAERGGNCEITQPGETIVHAGVTVMGPLNLPSTLAYHASQLFARNITTFLVHLTKEGQIQADPADEIARETRLTCEGEVVHPRVRELLSLSA
ncbi:MAG TPA: Re/Si-specific NAD(P)(+) transhydrogenase subunit alpha [Chthonomonadaceae bacterium]|nr:Re/Si-specific NAD(P)(+) transhydrogenase subunit alpha [Chthonomonadaceae bacterium]